MTTPDPRDDTTRRRREAARAFYAPLADARSAARRVGWEDDDAHRLRLNAIALAAGPFAGVERVVDAGCGEGALLPVLRARGFGGAYVGEDLLEHMVERARGLHAEDARASFRAADAFGAGPEADVVVCSGALNTLSGASDHDAEVAAAVRALWPRAIRRLVLDVAVADRHPPGAGIGRSNLAALWSLARELAPVVEVREDVVPGEALLVLSRSRAAGLSARLPTDEDALSRARLLLASGEPSAARAVVAGRESADAHLVAALADLGEGHHGRAEATLRRLARGPLAKTARLHLATVLWITGRRRASEKLLRELAEVDDDARVHLIELLVGTRRRDEAERVAATIEDAWIRREAERMLEG